MRNTNTNGENYGGDYYTTEAFTRSNCFKHLKSNILSAARGFEYLNDSAFDNPYNNTITTITNRQTGETPQCRHIHCKNKKLCSEISQNLHSASCKSSVLIPDTATNWFKNYKKLKTFIESMQNIPQDQVVQFYCHSKNRSIFQQPPSKCLKLKPPVRHAEMVLPNLNTIKHMSPEFQKLLYDHELKTRQNNRLHNLPNIQWCKKSRPKKISVGTSTRTLEDKEPNAEKDSKNIATKSGEHIKESLVDDHTANTAFKKSKDGRQQPPLDPYLEEIYKKPNATEMRESATSISPSKRDQKRRGNMFTDEDYENQNKNRKPSHTPLYSRSYLSKSTDSRRPAKKIKYNVTYKCTMDDLKRKRAGAEKHISFMDLDSDQDSKSESESDLTTSSSPPHINYCLDSVSSCTTVGNANRFPSNSTLTLLPYDASKHSRKEYANNPIRQPTGDTDYETQQQESRHNTPNVSKRTQESNIAAIASDYQEVSTSTRKPPARIRRRSESDTALYRFKLFI